MMQANDKDVLAAIWHTLPTWLYSCCGTDRTFEALPEVDGLCIRVPVILARPGVTNVNTV